MVFVCPPKEESDGRTKLLQNLRNIVQDLENQISIPVNPVCVPCCVPLVDLPQHNEVKPRKKELVQPCEAPNVMVCYKICEKKKQKNDKKKNGSNKPDEVVHRVKQSISRELRSSILYRGCDCEKTNGLQDDCQRTDCRGSPECLTKPPTCGPSEFCNGKHLMKKLNKRNEVQNSKNNASGGGYDNDIQESTVKYACFPAVIKSPVMCCPCEI